MLSRFLIRSFQAAFVVVMAVPAWAHDSYDYDGRDHYRRYAHDRRDQHERYDHYRRDRAQGGLGHAVGDIFRYGTTDPYSSPGHYYRDQHRAYDQYRRDQGRSYQHYSDDRRYSARDHHGDYAHGHYDPHY